MKDDISHSRAGALLVAGGMSSRMAGQDKIFLPLLGRPLLSYTLEALENTTEIESIVLVLSRENLEQGEYMIAQGNWRKISAICSGGTRRQDSVAAGLKHMADVPYIVVQDGARPCVTPALITHGLDVACETGAAIAAIPAKDTLKAVDDSGHIMHTLDRSGIWLAQTPQIFSSDILREAHRTIHEDVNDDATMVERMGVKVRVYMGSHENLKITTAEDIALAEAVLRKQGYSDKSEIG